MVLEILGIGHLISVAEVYGWQMFLSLFFGLNCHKQQRWQAMDRRVYLLC